MSDNILQYAIIGLIVLAAFGYLVRQFIPSRRRKKGCCGCGGSDETRKCS